MVAKGGQLERIVQVGHLARVTSEPGLDPRGVFERIFAPRAVESRIDSFRPGAGDFGHQVIVMLRVRALSGESSVRGGKQHGGGSDNAEEPHMPHFGWAGFARQGCERGSIHAGGLQKRAGEANGEQTPINQWCT